MLNLAKPFMFITLVTLFSAGVLAAETATTPPEWEKTYADFRAAVLEGDAQKAASLGDTFIDAAAQDLNYHNPEFGRIAQEVGAAHHRAGNFERASDLIGQAHAAFVFSNGYTDREAFDALILLADVKLDGGDLDDAIRLFNECLALSVIGGWETDRPGLLVGLADAYDKTDLRIARAIRKSPTFPTQE